MGSVESRFQTARVCGRGRGERLRRHQGSGNRCRPSVVDGVNRGSGPERDLDASGGDISREQGEHRFASGLRVSRSRSTRKAGKARRRVARCSFNGTAQPKRTVDCLVCGCWRFVGFSFWVFVSGFSSGFSFWFKIKIADSDCRFQIAHFRFQTAHFRLQIAHFRLQIQIDFRLHISDCRFQIQIQIADSDCRLQIADLCNPRHLG